MTSLLAVLGRCQRILQSLPLLDFPPLSVFFTVLFIHHQSFRIFILWTLVAKPVIGANSTQTAWEEVRRELEWAMWECTEGAAGLRNLSLFSLIPSRECEMAVCLTQTVTVGYIHWSSHWLRVNQRGRKKGGKVPKHIWIVITTKSKVKDWS